MRPFSQQALEAIRVTSARGPRSRRGAVSRKDGPWPVRRTLVRAGVVTAATAVLLLALATPVVASIR